MGSERTVGAVFSSCHKPSAREGALESLASSAVATIPGVDLVSITVLEDHALFTAAATDPMAERADALQYQMREGPCYAAVTDTRLVVANDIAASVEFPRYGPKAFDLGVGAQAAIQLVNGKGGATGLNLYARTAGKFDRSAVQIVEHFATHAGVLLGYAEQVDQLRVALSTRTDTGAAVGILMERYGLERDQAFAFLARNSQTRNVKLRALALQVIDGTFQINPHEDSERRSTRPPAGAPTGAPVLRSVDATYPVRP
jgi:hypothetical protein